VRGFINETIVIREFIIEGVLPYVETFGKIFEGIEIEVDGE